MNASISVICYKSKTLANGEHPLMIRIAKSGKKTYRSLGLSILLASIAHSKLAEYEDIYTQST